MEEVKKELIQTNVNRADVTDITFYKPVQIKQLRLKFSNFSGQPRLLLRQIQLRSKGIQ